jgi:hypothetical protein
MKVYQKVILVLVVTFIILAFLRLETNRTRESIGESIGDAVDEQVDEIVETTVGAASDAAGELVETVAGSASGSVVEVVESVTEASRLIIGDLKDVIRTYPEPPPRSTKPEDAGSDNSNKDANKVGSPSDSHSVLEGLFNFTVESAQSVTEVVDDQLQDMLKLSKQEEKELGAEIHQQLQGEGLEIIADPKLDSLIAKLVAPIFSEQLNTDQEYRFYVVNDMEVNAFACVGGNIYVNRGLIEFVDNEAQLQFVLGHEIGHIELGHSSRRFTFLVRGSQVGGELLSQLTGLVYQAVSLGYAENQELASDRFGYEHMTLDKQQVFSFLSRSHESQYGESISIDSPDKSGVVVRAIEGHFASHPTAEQRIRNLEALNQ